MWCQLQQWELTERLLPSGRGPKSFFEDGRQLVMAPISVANSSRQDELATTQAGKGPPRAWLECASSVAQAVSGTIPQQPSSCLFHRMA
mmetsp:Transcript_32605/g.85677  ORF Transcript_32605/g.85677 Transcript_32605/m.85677 type:complete len:89 (+) Transcript_32605:823-1089(+)